MPACSSAKRRKCCNHPDTLNYNCAIIVEILSCLHKGRTLQNLSETCAWLTLRFLLEIKMRPGHHTKFVRCALKLSENGLKVNQNT